MADPTPPDLAAEADAYLASLSDEERAEIIAAAETITPDDVARAAQGWRDDAPPALRTLLDARPSDD